MRSFCWIIGTWSFLISCFGLANPIEASALEKVIEDCQFKPREAHCLKSELEGLINNSKIESPNSQNEDPSQRFLCKSDGEKFAVFDSSKKLFLDLRYSKSSVECESSIANIKNGLFCAGNSHSRFIVRTINSRVFIGTSYALTFDDCLRVIANVHQNTLCVGSPNGKFVRYNLKTKESLDKQYSLELNDCLALL